MTVRRPNYRRLGLAASLLALTAASLAVAETRPTLNFSGATGLIDMPSGEAQPDGMLSVSSTHFGPVSRTTLSFQLSPRISASFRYAGTRNWNEVVDDTRFDTYYDRSFDLRFRLTDEGRYMPAITLGLQDFIGTGLYSGEYIVATKQIAPQVKVTAGLGWGRLGSYGGIGAPFGDRPPIDFGRGGEAETAQWFKGDAAPFAGIEWQINDKWGVKAEYSSDDYTEESGNRETFDRKSPFNFGVEYQPNESVRLGAYYLYGSEVGLAAHFFLNPKQRATGGISGAAPKPVRPRPSPAADPDAWSPEWVLQDGVAVVLRENLVKRLEEDGIVLESLGYTGTTATLRIRNTRIDSEAQAIGRAARAMSQVMPASVETFEIVPMAKGIPTARVVLRRSDLERLEYTPGNGDAIGERAVIADAARLGEPAIMGEGLYPRFTWSVLPDLRTSLFDPDEPVRADIGVRLSASYDIAPGFVLSGSVVQKIAGNIGDNDRESNSVLPKVRTDASKYSAEGETAIDELTLAWYSRPAENLYGRVTAGYLERMFGGVSAEVLWKRPASPLAIGAEVNYVQQRDFDQKFGFQDYDVVTGHVSAYYSFGNGYTGQLDVGRYLAGDWGATVAIDREFGNGWRVGAFATKTDVSAEEFGEGSFDKGIRLEIPLNWITGQPTRKTYSATLRPLLRDGGAKLNVDGRLHELVRDYDQSTLDQQWGRFWR